MCVVLDNACVVRIMVSMNHTCSHCHTAIQNGMAAIRTIMFDRVAFHRDCPHTVTAKPQFALAV